MLVNGRTAMLFSGTAGGVETAVFVSVALANLAAGRCEKIEKVATTAIPTMMSANTGFQKRAVRGAPAAKMASCAFALPGLPDLNLAGGSGLPSSSV
jgi:hypothetical protein